jgi:transposase
MSKAARPYPTDVSDEDWEFLAPYLALVREDSPQRVYDLRLVFNAVRYVAKTGGQWRMMPHDFPPWEAVYQQARRWMAAKVFEAIAHDLRVILRIVGEREGQPTAAILDARTVQSTPESGSRAGYDGHKRRKGSKVHIAVDTLGNLLALKVTAASEQERAQVAEMAAAVQEVTGKRVEVAFVDQGYTGEAAERAASAEGIKLEVVRHTEAKRGFVLLPRRWVVERSFGWAARFRRLAKDYERLTETLEGMHYVAFSLLMLHRAVPHFCWSS